MKQMTRSEASGPMMNIQSSSSPEHVATTASPRLLLPVNRLPFAAIASLRAS
jgi:hypothetical protein